MTGRRPNKLRGAKTPSAARSETYAHSVQRLCDVEDSDATTSHGFNYRETG